MEYDFFFLYLLCICFFTSCIIFFVCVCIASCIFYLSLLHCLLTVIRNLYLQVKYLIRCLYGLNPSLLLLLISFYPDAMFWRSDPLFWWGHASSWLKHIANNDIRLKQTSSLIDTAERCFHGNGSISGLYCHMPAHFQGNEWELLYIWQLHSWH